ncbi:MAG: hypothetical protein HC811_11400 [Flammeovirgaceae bacterium]|nr:hypothetical protein [Flammeovirgaceae bacterium]
MKKIFKTGDRKISTFVVKNEDQAAFHGEVLHSVCSTFALAREMEWSSRLFFIEMREENEEGVGTMLTIDHKSPAFVGETLTITATVESIIKNELICNITVMADNREVASGRTGQKMLKKEKLNQIFTKPK